MNDALYIDNIRVEVHPETNICYIYSENEIMQKKILKYLDKEGFFTSPNIMVIIKDHKGNETLK